MMRGRVEVLYASDLHGEIHLYDQLLRLAQLSSVQIIALGGDLFPSFPPSKRYEDMIPNQRTFIDQFFIPFFKRILKTSDVKHLFLIPGNWDLAYPYLFKEERGGLVDLDRKIYRLVNGYEIVGYPFVPPTPFRPKDYEKMDNDQSPWPPQKHPSYIRASYQGEGLSTIDPHLYLRSQRTIEEELNYLPKPQSLKKAIYMMHSPPFGTRLDLIQGRKSAGSRSIKAFIEKNQPFLTLHGHIHESAQLSGSYVDRIGETLAINPGQLISMNLQAVTFEIERLEKTLKHTHFSEGIGDSIF